MKAPQNLARLIEKYQAGTASLEEINLLNEWYHSFDDSEAEMETGNITEEQLAGRIRNRLINTISSGNKKTVIPVRRKWRLAAAAIIIGVLLAGGAYLLYGSNENLPASEQKEVPVTKKPAGEILPGGNKALLTLADGTTIILDSAVNGIISTQGNIKVEKLNNGLLAYKVNGKMVTENDEAFYNTISTPRGGQYQVTLSDGTKVWLNAASSIRFPVVFTGTQRKVEVTGETYFEVAKNPSMPFKVTATAAEVEVLGTHFNINAYNDESTLKTTLLEGKVKISIPSSAAGSSPEFLVPGQQSSISKNGTIRILNNADTEEAVAWKNGRFQFKSADLRSILRQIARWYDVEVEYMGNVDLHFTGQITRDDKVSKVFEKLQLTGEVHFKTEGRKIIVSR